MNKDFHYYGTYLAALGAGFLPEEARRIAWASQMTDDCTASFLKSIAGSGNWKHRVVTCQDLTELASSNMHSMSDLNNEELKYVRNIWMPFHFLPGNLDGKYQYRGERTWCGDHYDEVRDGMDFKCICLHNSGLAYTMVSDTISRYSAQSSEETMKQLLYLIGIRMHVLADTWAHEYFTGTPNYWVNKVTEIKKRSGIPDSPQAAPGAVSYYSIVYLGHGQAGHYPDYGNISYTFRPHWLSADTQPLEKKNPELFRSAFFQMLDAMIAIRTGREFPQRQGVGVPVDQVLTAPYGITADDILSVVRTEKLDQSQAWKDLLMEKGVVRAQDMSAFDYCKNDPLYSLEDFCENAEIQRNLVARQLECAGVGVLL